MLAGGAVGVFFVSKAVSISKSAAFKFMWWSEKSRSDDQKDPDIQSGQEIDHAEK